MRKDSRLCKGMDGDMGAVVGHKLSITSELSVVLRSVAVWHGKVLLCWSNMQRDAPASLNGIQAV
jgi:hypothetical protein